MNKRIVFNNLGGIKGNNKEEEFKDMLQDSGVTLYNNNYGGTIPDETQDETIAIADDSAMVSEPTFNEEIIEAQEDDNIIGQVEAPITKLPEEPKSEELPKEREEPKIKQDTDLFKDDTEDEVDEEEKEEKEEEEEEEDEISFDSISLKEKFPLDIWGLIDTYFRDNDYYKSKHQLDSYNEFIYSKTNGIEYIIKRENPLIIYKEPLNIERSKFKYEISIYFGESFDEEGNIKDQKIYFYQPLQFIIMMKKK